MSRERNTSSVLSRLMGFDRLAPLRKADGRRRVLSENYLRDVNSVIHMKKSVLDDHVVECDKTVESSEGEMVDFRESLVFGSTSSGLVTHSGDSGMKKYWNEETFFPKTPSFEQHEGFNQRGLTSSSNTLIGQPRSCHNIDTGRTNKKQKTAFGARNKGSGLKERRVNGSYHNGRECTVRKYESPKGIAKQITNQVNNSVWHSCLKVPSSEVRVTESGADEDKGALPSKRCSRSTHKTTKMHFESRRGGKYFQEWGSCRVRKTEDQFHDSGTFRSIYTLNREEVDSRTLVNGNAYSCQVASTRYLSKKTLFPSAWVPRTKERRFTLDRNWCSRPGDTNSNLYNESSEDNVGLESLNVTCGSVPSSVKTEKVTLDEKIDMSSKLPGEQPSVKLSKTNMCDDEVPCPVDFVSKHELKSKISPPRSPVSSLDGPEACRCQNFTVKSKEISIPQWSDEDVLGLYSKFHLNEPISIESSSEGPGMVVSSDASDGGGSVGCYREDTQIAERTSESCDFSYLVDVLTESGMMTGNLEMDNERWCHGRSMLDPSVFDLLEKKYGKSNVRQRSERRLLFDRINTGLKEILIPYVGIQSWRKPLVKRLSAKSSCVFVEDELWALLVNQEEFNRDLCDKVCKRDAEWLDIEEDVDIIVEEIQSLLIDELLEALVKEAAFM